MDIIVEADHPLSETRLIVGLGNPEAKYQFTRHNFGFLVAEAIAETIGIKFRKDTDAKGLIGSGRWDDMNVIVLLPLTYMNLSGLSVRSVLNKKLIVVI